MKLSRNISTLREWEVISCDRVAGVYMLLWDGAVQYIGESCNIYGRVDLHRNEGRIRFNEVRVVRLRGAAARCALERQLIRHHNPPINYVNTTRAGFRQRPPVYVKCSSVRFRGDNWGHVKILARAEDRSANDFLNMMVERLWRAIPVTERNGN